MWRAFLRPQSKEIARLNGVYNNLLKDAGVEFIGAPPPFLLGARMHLHACIVLMRA